MYFFTADRAPLRHGQRVRSFEIVSALWQQSIFWDDEIEKECSDEPRISYLEGIGWDIATWILANNCQYPYTLEWAEEISYKDHFALHEYQNKLEQALCIDGLCPKEYRSRYPPARPAARARE